MYMVSWAGLAVCQYNLLYLLSQNVHGCSGIVQNGTTIV